MAKSREVVDQPEIEPKKVGSLYASTDLLKVLAEYINDCLPRVGFEEDHFWTNIRIIFCIISCSFGMYAQFVAKFPTDRMIIMLCVVGYFSFSGLLGLMDYLVIKESIMHIQINNELVYVDCGVEPFSTACHISLRSATKLVKHSDQVTKYFDSEGFLVQENLFKDVMALITKFEAEQKGDGKKNQ